ncbi:hypothetical protein PILCRDRAFT_260367 [Piloderma croceum F 1598]|uniref:Uncharacterized protein n=1 Tax=Piloderma croceum (strain F 1598) TaxID=765440 RepID=A0A0C3FTT1_PILCF|nr:hypothetical protein PILCRDRAFT_260367 [Piloderma croceum F 1598]
MTLMHQLDSFMMFASKFPWFLLMSATHLRTPHRYFPVKAQFASLVGLRGSKN